MQRRSVVWCTLAVLTAGAAWAQRGPMGEGHGMQMDPQKMIQMRVKSMTRQLNLTDAQKTNVTTILTNEQKSAQTIQQDLRTNREAINTAVKKNDTAAIDKLASTVGTLEGQLIAVRSKAEAAVFALLTPEQQAKYDEMPRGGMMGMRPGGPGRPGGPDGPGGMGMVPERMGPPPQEW